MESYSYSKLSTFDSCNFRFYLQYICKITSPFSDNATLEKGRFIHHLLEHHPEEKEFKFKYPEVKANEEAHRNLVKHLVTNQSRIKFLLGDALFAREVRFYLDKDFKICKGKADSLTNGIIDYVGLHGTSVLLVDWKSGQTQSLASLDQLIFYSIWAFEKFPEADKVNCYLFFVEQNVFKHVTITREQLPEIKDKYKKKIEQIETATEWPKSRGEKCQWCPFLIQCSKVNLKR